MKIPDEMAVIVHANVGGNLRHVVIGSTQQFTRFFKA